MAQIAVIGISSFGYYLARKLAELGSEVLVVDCDEEKVDTIKAYVTKAVVADATDKRTLKQLGLSNMDAVVLSMGSQMESSIISALHLKEMEVKKIVAKSLSEDHSKILELLKVDRIVFPERDIGERLATSLQGRNIADYLPLGSGISIVEMVPTEEMIGKTLTELEFRSRYKAQVMAIKKKEPEEDTFIPEPSTKIKRGHLLFVLGKDDDLERFRKE